MWWAKPCNGDLCCQDPAKGVCKKEEQSRNESYQQPEYY